MTRGIALFFWKREKEVKKITPELKTARETWQGKKYKTNYYSYNSVRRRDSLRSKKQRKHEIGEYKLEVELTHLPRCFRRLSNLLLKTKGGFQQIDHLLISPYGIFLLEVNNLSGLIVGEEEDPKWYQSITWRVKPFPNPILENQVRIKVLQELAGLDETIPVFSYVTFNRRCNLKVFSSVVFYDIDLLASIIKLTQNQPVVLCDEEILQIIERIEKINVTELGIRNEYAARQRRERMQHRPKYGDIRCSICQKAVNERMARYCLNRPEKFAWKIYCEKHQREMTRVVRREYTQREEYEEIGNGKGRERHDTYVKTGDPKKESMD